MDLQGKKILVLGTTQSVYDIVVTAKRLGLYVVITDNYENSVIRQMKIADEVLNFSTNDYENLQRYIMENRIDGVFAGASEFNVQNMVWLCDKCGLPCYCTPLQNETVQNKRNFKDICKKSGVNIVPEYTAKDYDKIVYPIMVKPADSCASKGMTVCHSPSELQGAIDYALSFSTSQDVIVEKLMTCKNLSVYYTIQNGYASLSAIGDWYKYNNKYGVGTITSAIVFPSVYTDTYIKLMHPRICNLIKELDIQNGVMNLQMFFDDNNIFVYEACYRICGTQEYNIVSRINNLNSLEMMIQYAVSGQFGESNEVKDKDDPYFNGKYACNLAVMLLPGVINKIEGFEELSLIDGIVNISMPKICGDVIKESDIGTLNQTFTRMHLICDSKNEIKSVIKQVFDLLRITDQNKESMIQPIPESLANWLEQ